MKKLLYILLLPILSYGQTQKIVEKKIGENILIVDEGGTVPTPSPCANCLGIQPIIVDPVTGVMTITYSNGSVYVSPPLKGAKGDKGDAGRGIVSSVVDPTTGILTITYTDGTKYISQSLIGPPGPSQCTNCSGGTAGGTKEYWVTDAAFGAKGDGVTDDTQAFRNAVTAMINNRGKLVVPPPANNYKITGPIVIEASAGFVRCEIASWGWGNGTNTIRYSGPSNTSVFQFIGIKQILVTGLSIGVNDGRDHITLYDIDTRLGKESSTGSTFKSMYLDLNAGVYNVAFKLGHVSVGVADVANIQWENVAVYGQRKEGQIAYQIEGQNTLSQTWIGGFVAFCHKAISNNSSPGATKDRGNGSLFIFGLGCSQNIIDFDFNFEQTYTITGGRFEGSSAQGPTTALSGSKFMNIGPHSYHASITVIGAHVSEYAPPDGALITMATGGSLNIIGMEGFRTNNVFNPVVALNGNGMKGTLIIDGGAFSANKGNLYRKTGGSTIWKVYVRGVSKYNGGVYTDDWFDDVSAQLIP